MRITKIFDNASLRTVNEGYIELDCNNKTHCFHNASVISVNNGIITIEVDWKPEKGELIKLSGGIDCYVVFNYIFNASQNILYTYGNINVDFASHKYFKLCHDQWIFNDTVQLSPVTPEEQQAFDDFCKSQGKIWNKEKLQWEEYIWMPKKDEKYYYINTIGEVAHTNNTLSLDQLRIEFGNCFQTIEKAEIAAEKFKEFFKSL